MKKLLLSTQKEFDELLDYSCTFPTGTTPGKRWKRRKDYHDESKGWLIGQYDENVDDPENIQVTFFQVEIVLEQNVTGVLLPCPFCGASADYIKPNRGWGMFVGCSGCQAEMYSIDETDLLDLEKQKIAVLKNWNRRESND